MLGDIIGKVLAAPVRLANIPVKVVSKAADFALGERNGRRRRRCA